MYSMNLGLRIQSAMEDVPFDLQQLRVLLYDKNDSVWGRTLTKSLTIALSETLENPIDSVPSILRKSGESHASEQDDAHALLDALESQIRSLRVRDIISMRYNEPWDTELKKISGPEDLDNWAKRRLKDGLPITLLGKSIRNDKNIPSEEEERIVNTFKKFCPTCACSEPKNLPDFGQGDACVQFMRKISHKMLSLRYQQLKSTFS